MRVSSFDQRPLEPEKGDKAERGEGGMQNARRRRREHVAEKMLGGTLSSSSLSVDTTACIGGNLQQQTERERKRALRQSHLHEAMKSHTSSFSEVVSLSGNARKQDHSSACTRRQHMPSQENSNTTSSIHFLPKSKFCCRRRRPLPL